MKTETENTETVLVPRDLTEAMLQAAEVELSEILNDFPYFLPMDAMLRIWRSLLSAAPAPAKAEGRSP